MKEKILKMFFEESNELLFIDETIDKKTYDNSIKIEKARSNLKIMKSFIVILSIVFLFLVTLELIFPMGPFTYGFLHNIVFALFLIIVGNMLTDYFYIKKIFELFEQGIDKNNLKKIKSIFIALIIASVLGIHNICFELFRTFKFGELFYLILTIITLLLISMCFILGTSLINKIFNKIEEIKKETDGLV